MKISREAQYMARQLFDAAFVNGRLDEARSLTIAETIVSSRPRHAFHILKEFTRLLRLELAQHHAVIESATPLEAVSEKAIIAVLQARDPQLTFSVSTNALLIGGARIQLGSDVWDGSVAAKLEKIKTL